LRRKEKCPGNAAKELQEGDVVIDGAVEYRKGQTLDLNDEAGQGGTGAERKRTLAYRSCGTWSAWIGLILLLPRLPKLGLAMTPIEGDRSFRSLKGAALWG
jgi:hypothetical protein